MFPLSPEISNLKELNSMMGSINSKPRFISIVPNHGQFNTVWGNHDSGMPGALLLNTKALLKGEDQRQIAKVYMGAFLEMTLKGNQAYLPIFKDYRYAEKMVARNPLHQSF